LITSKLVNLGVIHYAEFSGHVYFQFPDYLKYDFTIFRNIDLPRYITAKMQIFKILK